MRDMSEIRRNIRSVEETRQVTNAMFLLSTSRMKHAMQQIGHNREYMKRIRAAVHEILAHMPQDDHPFMRYSKEKDTRPSYLVIAADKGLQRTGKVLFSSIENGLRDRLQPSQVNSCQ